MSSTHPSLPPISMFTSRSQPPSQSTTALPASPPSSGYDHKQMKSLPILPKPLNSEYYLPQGERPEILSPPQHHHYYNNHHHNRSHHTPPTTTATITSPTTTAAAPDQSTLWALFNQFQQQQQQQQKVDHYQEVNRRASSSSSTASTSPAALAATDNRGLSSEEVLAEKRRRNAGASARFRDRRKQRERELSDKCNELEHRSKEFENALRRLDPDHPLLSTQKHSYVVDYSNRSTSSSPPPSDTLVDRVGQLEHLMTRFRQEKETDVQKLDQLEKENKYLKSLLVPVSLPPTSRKHGLEFNKRMKLSHPTSSSASSISSLDDTAAD